MTPPAEMIGTASLRHRSGHEWTQDDLASAQQWLSRKFTIGQNRKRAASQH